MRNALIMMFAVCGFVFQATHAQDTGDLFAAIERTDVTSLRNALEAGADANAINEAGSSALFEAVRKQSLDACRLLVAAGADVNFVNEQNIGATPLMMAVGYKEPQIVNLLLENDADVNLADANGDPAINWAAYYGYTDIAERLLKAGADTEQVGHGNPREIAMRRGHQTFVSLMARLADIPLPSPDTALLIEAINSENLDALEDALALGASPSATDFTGRPVLGLAARTGNAALVKRLVEAGASPDAADEIGFSPLMEAARDGKTDVVQYLLSLEVDANRRSNASALHLTPMHMAALSGNAGIVRLLAQAGASLDPQGRDGGTPMIWALSESKMATVEALLDLGADAAIKNKFGFSAIDFARQLQNNELLQKMGAEVDT